MAQSLGLIPSARRPCSTAPAQRSVRRRRHRQQGLAGYSDSRSISGSSGCIALACDCNAAPASRRRCARASIRARHRPSRFRPAAAWLRLHPLLANRWASAAAFAARSAASLRAQVVVLSVRRRANPARASSAARPRRPLGRRRDQRNEQADTKRRKERNDAVLMGDHHLLVHHQRFGVGRPRSGHSPGRISRRNGWELPTACTPSNSNSLASPLHSVFSGR